MATYTSHYNLKKPATSDKIRIADFNGNFDIIDGQMYDNETLGAQLKADIGIVENTNTASHNISEGQYVIWKGSLYVASSAISSGATLSDANLTAVSGGGLNALNGKIDNLGFTIPQGTWENVVNNYSVLIAVAKGTVNGNKVALSIMIPTAALEDTARLWVVTDAYNNTSAIHFQVSASKITYTAGMNYGAGSVSDASYSWYGF